LRDIWIQELDKSLFHIGHLAFAAPAAIHRTPAIVTKVPWAILNVLPAIRTNRISLAPIKPNARRRQCEQEKHKEDGLPVMLHLPWRC
jgi:hypothetical protein